MMALERMTGKDQHSHVIAIWVLDNLFKCMTSCQVPRDHVTRFEVFSAGFSPRNSMGKSATCCHLPRGFPFISGGWLIELPTEGNQILSKGYRNNLHSCILPNEFPSAYAGELNSFGEVQKQNSNIKDLHCISASHQRSSLLCMNEGKEA